MHFYDRCRSGNWDPVWHKLYAGQTATDRANICRPTQIYVQKQMFGQTCVCHCIRNATLC